MDITNLQVKVIKAADTAAVMVPGLETAIMEVIVEVGEVITGIEEFEHRLL